MRTAIILCTLLVSTTALAHPDVDAGKQAFLKGEYRAALARLEEAERSPTVTEEDLVDIHWYRGASFYALGKKDDANKSFDELLLVRPLYTPNKLETPPDVRAAFKKRSDAYQRANGINVSAPQFAEASLNVSLDGKLADANKLAVYARPAGQKTYKRFDFPVTDGKVQGQLNENALWEQSGKAGKMELVLEVLNARGTPVSRSGDALKPLSVPISDEQVQSALNALKPPPAPPVEKPAPPVEKPAETAAAQPPPPTTTTPPKDEPKESGGNPAATALGVAGAGLVGIAVIALLGVVGGGVGAAASGGGLAYIYSEATKVGAQKNPNDALYRQAWLPLQASAIGLGVFAGVAAVVTVLFGLVGVGLFVARGVMG